MVAGFFCISVRFFGGVISHISTRWEGSWMVDVSSIMAKSKLSGDPPQASVVQVLLYSQLCRHSLGRKVMYVRTYILYCTVKQRL